VKNCRKKRKTIKENMKMGRKRIKETCKFGGRGEE
jgi:hypothetical protein